MKQKILILHNQISPYREPIFESLSLLYDLSVFYCEAVSSKRKWKINNASLNYSSIILRNKFLGPFYFNYDLILKIISSKANIFITVDTSEAALSCLVTVFMAKILRKKIIIWSGKISDEINFFPTLRHPTHFVRNKVYTLLLLITRVYHYVIYSLADRFIAYSYKSKDFLTSYGVLPNIIFVGTQIYPELLLPQPVDSMRLDKCTTYLYIGYLEKRKAVDLLIKAYMQINISNSILKIVGDGPEKGLLKEIARENKNILFIDNVDLQERADLYATADVTILPTSFDVWGFVVNESLYYGTPVIVSDAAVASELIIDGANGFIFKSGNLEELADKMQILANNKLLLQSLKKSARDAPKVNLVNIDYAVNTFKATIESL